MKRLALLLLPFLALLNLSAMAQDMEIPLRPDVISGQLDNGLQYYILPNEKPEDRAELRLAVNIGSLAENENQQGLAHFVEHMAFNGTENFPKNELIDFLELSGVKFGAHLNAYTSFDETVYMLQLPTDEPELLEKGVQVLEEWASKITFSEEEIDKERGVVIEEWRMRSGPQMRMVYEYYPVLLKDSRYPERLPIGKVDVLKNFDYETLRSFYHEWYRPELMTVVAVGDFDAAKMEEMIREKFSDLENPEKVRARELYEVPFHKDVLAKVVTDPEAPFTNINVYYKRPAETNTEVADFDEELVQRLHNQMMNARLEEVNNQGDPPFLFYFTGFNNVNRTTDAYTSMGYVNETGIERGLRVLLEETERVQRYGFTEAELERAKQSLLTGLEQSVKEKSKTESRRIASQLVRLGLEDDPYPGPQWEYEQAQKLLPQISLQNVNDISKDWIRDENVVIVAQAPEKEGLEVPTEEDLLAIFNEVEEQELEPWEEEEIASELMTAIPEPAAITETKTYETTGIKEITLANGAKVVLKPTDFQNDQILFGALSKGGSSLYNKEDFLDAEYAASLVNQAGVGEFSSTDLEKVLSGKVVRVSPYISGQREGVSGSASTEDLETLLQLTHLYFTDPRVDDQAFQSLLQKQRVLFQNLGQQPDYFFYDYTDRVLTQDHPRAGFLRTEEELASVDKERAMEIYRERFSNAGDFTFFFVGNFEEEELLPLVQRYIGSLPGEAAAEKVADVGLRYPEGKIEEVVQKGLEPKTWVGMHFVGPYEYSRENNHVLEALTSVLEIRLREKLREEAGGVYGVSISESTSKLPNEDYHVSISFSADPEKADSLIMLTMQEIEKVKKGNVLPEDLEKIQEKKKRERQANLQENRWWLQNIQQAYFLGGNPDELTRPHLIEEGVTAKQIQKAAKKYLDEEGYVQLKMNPEEGISQE